MKITVEETHLATEPEVIVRCQRVDGQILRLLERLRLAEAVLTGTRDNETHILSPDDILYIDTVERKTFFYTAAGVYESALRLYELEEWLAALDFLRVSKSAIVNFTHLRALRPDLGGRLRLTLSNGELIVANRQYAPAIKTRLGIGKERS